MNGVKLLGLTIAHFNNARIAVFEHGNLKGVCPDNWQKSHWIDNPETLPENYGIAIPDGILIIDVDLYKPEAQNSLDALIAFGLNPSNTFQCRTGRGGKHLWFRIPNRFKIQKHPKLFPDVDFLTKGMYVVGPGSEVYDKKGGGGYYSIEGGRLEALGDLPLNILDLVVKQDLVVSTGTEIADVETFDRFVETYPPAVQGQNGDEHTYRLACWAKDYGLTQQECFDAIQEWNQKCIPPWSAAELQQKINHAYSYGRNAQGSKVVQTTEFTPIEQPDGKPTWHFETKTHEEVWADTAGARISWDTTQAGVMKTTFNNLKLLLDVCTADNRVDLLFENLFMYDEWRRKVILTRRPFWRAPTINMDTSLTDADILEVRMFFATTKRLDFSKEIIGDAIIWAAHRNKIHPIQTWLNTLEWDGTPRLQHLFNEYSNSPNDEFYKYRANMAKAFLLAAIQRVMNPGSKWDNCLVLVGPQGCGKSRLIEILGGEFATTLLSLRGDKACQEIIARSWIVELPELSATSKSDVNEIKAILSITQDTFRAAYARVAETVPRACVFFWTLNAVPGQGFLRDETGARRFRIVEFEESLDLPTIAQNRDQMFAEAMEMYRKGDEAYLYLERDKDQTQALHDKHYQDDYDTWEELLAQFVSDDTIGNEARASYADLFEYLGIYQRDMQNPKAKHRVNKCMRKLGWEPGNFRRMSHVYRGFIKRLDISDGL